MHYSLKYKHLIKLYLLYGLAETMAVKIISHTKYKSCEFLYLI